VAENDSPETPEQAREKQRLADHARLVELKRSAEQARTEVQAGAYVVGAWDPWQKLAEEYQAALTAHVSEYGGNRYEVEKSIWAALHEPEAA
jgi:hypothetical protein